MMSTNEGYTEVLVPKFCAHWPKRYSYSITATVKELCSQSFVIVFDNTISLNEITAVLFEKVDFNVTIQIEGGILSVHTEVYWIVSLIFSNSIGHNEI